MNSRFATRQHSLRHERAAAPAATGVRSVVRVDAAANDDTAKSAFDIFNDPLFGMAIASGILFAILAALIAFG